MPVRRFFFIILFVTLQLVVISQTPKIDGLRKELYQSNLASQKLEKYLALLDERFSLPVDSVWFYINQAKLLAATNTQKTREILVAEASINIMEGKGARARKMLDSLLLKVSADDAANRNLYFKLALAKLSSTGFGDDINDATALGYKIYREAEQYKDTATMAQALTDVATFYYNMDFVKKAIETNHQALSITVNTRCFYQVLSAICINLGDAYWWESQYDSADYFINKGITYAKEIQNLYYVYVGLQKLASVKIDARDFTGAEKDILNSIDIYKKIYGDIPSSRTLVSLGRLYRHWGKPDKAIAIITEGIKQDSLYRIKKAKGRSSLEIDNMQDMALYQLLGTCYKDKGDYIQYAATLEKISAYKDTLYKKNTAEALAELQTKYEVQQKETTIAKQQLQLVQRQNIIIIVLSAIILISIVSYFLFKNYRRKQQRKSRDAVKTAEEKERRRIAADLHDNLGVQANAILYTSELLKQEQQKDDLLVSNMNETAKGMLFFLRETLWALKSADTTAQQLWLRVLNFVTQMKRNYPNIQFLTSGTAPEDFNLSSARALNLLMIIQESVNNSIKHSGGNTINILGEIKDKIWCINIQDNGRGFYLGEAQSKEESNGLKNITERAQNSNFTIDIDTKKEDGTKIRIGIGE